MAPLATTQPPRSTQHCRISRYAVKQMAIHGGDRLREYKLLNFKNVWIIVHGHFSSVQKRSNFTLTKNNNIATEKC
jgi:hypothetical protein